MESSQRKQYSNFGLYILGGIGIGIAFFALYNPGEAYFTEEQLIIADMTDYNILVVKPLLTANAYRSGGFYDYYQGKCDESCLSVQIDESIPYTYDSSLRAIVRFEQLGANMTDDYTVDPTTLKDYDKIILLHNEYVTQEFFDSVQNHPNVVYMYPNALHAKVTTYNGIMTLIEGHGYKGKYNGFGWEYDNSKYESDNLCESLDVIEIPNGKQLTCYPENFLMKETWLFPYVRNL